MTNKSPAFQWYPKDILSSVRVQLMTLAEECAYRRLLDYCWINGSIPADPAKAARLVGKGCSSEIVKTALEMFEADPTDAEKLIHDRLEIEREKQESNSEARRNAANERWKKQGKSNENGKSGKPAEARGTRDEAANSNGKQVESKSDANALQTDMQNDALHIASSSSTSEENKNKGGGLANTPAHTPAREESPPADRPAVFVSDEEKRMTKKQFAEHLKTLFAHLDDVDFKTRECVGWYQRRFSRAPNRLEVKKWLTDEYEDVSAAALDPNKTPDWKKSIENCGLCDSRGLVKGDKGMQKCRHGEK